MKKLKHFYLFTTLLIISSTTKTSLCKTTQSPVDSAKHGSALLHVQDPPLGPVFKKEESGLGLTKVLPPKFSKPPCPTAKTLPPLEESQSYPTMQKAKYPLSFLNFIEQNNRGTKTETTQQFEESKSTQKRDVNDLLKKKFTSDIFTEIADLVYFKKILVKQEEVEILTLESELGVGSLKEKLLDRFNQIILDPNSHIATYESETLSETGTSYSK